MDVRRVVVGVDFSGVMLRAATWLREHVASGSEIVLVHATEQPDVPDFLRGLVRSEDVARERALDEAHARLAGWRDTVGLGEARVEVREGRADEVLRAVARDVGADLTVIGAHGGRKRPWLQLGTTAERLLRAAETSLLVVRGPMSEAPRRILVAVDDAEITPRVLGVAGTLADRFDARIHAVHVLSNAAYSHLASIDAAQSQSESEAHAKVEDDIAAEALRWLKELWCSTKRHGKLEIEVPHGVPGDEILRVADDFAANLIIIGRYGAGRILPAVLGSVVGSVVHGASCPVLVVSDSPPPA